MQYVWPLLKRWGIQLSRQFGHATPVLLALGIGLAWIAIWWLGPLWVWHGHAPLAELPMRILASMLLPMVPLMVWTLSTRRRYRRLQAECSQASARVADPCLPFVEAQQNALDRRLAIFLNSLHGRRSLHDIPWYLLLGESAAGKTEFVTRSGQRSLPSQVNGSAGAFREDDLAYPLDWWITDDALLIDTPGQFVSAAPARTADQEASPGAQSARLPVGHLPAGTDERLWRHLLDWLGAHRSRQALNGVVVVIDMARLLEQGDEYRDHLALCLRTRLSELTQGLGIRLPVYVVLSKMDLLAGFTELFSRLPQARKAGLLGFTFSLDAVTRFDAWLDELEEQLDRFVRVMSEQTCDAILAAPERAARERLHSLHVVFAGLRPVLVSFLRSTLSCDRFTTPALVRGVYLTSAQQQGESLNALTESISRTYRLPLPVVDTRSGVGTLGYFVQGLCQRAVYPEAGLAGDNIKVARHKRRVLLGSAAVAALCVLLATGVWHQYFVINRDKAGMVLARGEQFGTSVIDTQLDSTGRNLLAPLGQIRNALAVYGGYRDAWPGVSDFGLYQGRAIGPRVDEAYLSLLSRQFLPAIASGVIARVGTAPEGSDQQLAALRVYRMIEDRPNRQPQWVREWMAQEWQLAYPGQGWLQEALMHHLEYALEYASAQLPDYHAQVAEAQQQLRRVPLPQRVYAALRQGAGEGLTKDVNLRHEVGPAFDLIYRTPHEEGGARAPAFAIPGWLTAKGYRGYFERRNEDLVQMAIVDQWVLGERRRIDYSPADRNDLSNRLNALYSADYVAHWRSALNQLTVTDFSDLAHGVSVLEAVTGPAAPLRRLLEAVRVNSQLQASAVPVPEPMSALLAEEFSPVAAIRREFFPLARLLDEKDDKPAYYEEVLNAIGSLHEYSKAIQDSPDRGKAALAAVRARFALTGPDPIGTVQHMAAGLPEPINLQVAKLAEQTSQVLMIEALRELEKRWDNEVYQFYQQRLAGRYPFAPSGSDASLEDFEAFFGPNGRLQQFQDRYLNLFIRENLDALKNTGTGAYLVRTDVLDQLRAAERIRETFFDNRGGLGVQFSLEPLGLSGNKRSSVLALDGQLIPYSHGPSERIGLIWPNTLTEGPGSKLAVVHASGATGSLGFKGPWSLFRLLSSGQLNGYTQTSVELSFRIGDAIMRYRVVAEKSLNPFTQQPFKGFVLPRTLLNPVELQMASHPAELAGRSM
jgi:type VI secretion system protein ImpL